VDASTGIQRNSPLILRAIKFFTGPLTYKNLLSWGLLLFAILFIKGCLIDQYTVPTGSMEPAIHGDPRFFRGDRVLVNKWLYGPRIPFTTCRLWNWAQPKRWDIVVFRRVSKSGPPILIKRVAGLPGEKVHIQDGALYVNGQRIDPPPELWDNLHYTTRLYPGDEQVKRRFLYLAQTSDTFTMLNPPDAATQQLYDDRERCRDRVKGIDIAALSGEEVDRLCEGVSPEGLRVLREYSEFELPALFYGVRPEPQYSEIFSDGYYFLLGDNSAESVDGRIWGWVPENYILGRAFAIWWPWNRRCDFTGFSQTWWGISVLYGIPLALIFFESYRFFRERRKNTPTE